MWFDAKPQAVVQTTAPSFRGLVSDTLTWISSEHLI